MLLLFKKRKKKTVPVEEKKFAGLPDNALKKKSVGTDSQR